MRKRADVRITAIRGTAAAVLLSAAVLGLAGCVNAEQAAPAGAGESQSYGAAPTSSAAAPSGSPSSASIAPGDHNAADVAFVDQAVQLRQQAVALSDKASSVSTSAQVRQLAAQISGDPIPLVDTLNGWLQQWGQPAASSVPGQVPGLLTDSQVKQIESATGTPFDMQWLQGIKGNLTAAQAAATAEVSKGSNSAAKQAAQEWIAEIKGELTKLSAITG